MRASYLFAGMALTITACSEGSRTNDAAPALQEDAPETQFNDVATGARLMREHTLGKGSPQERVTTMAECAGTLLTAAKQDPPPVSAAERLEEAADRLLKLAVNLGASNGMTEPQVIALRDQAAAANEHLEAKDSAVFGRLIEPATKTCYMGSILTDQELTG